MALEKHIGRYYFITLVLRRVVKTRLEYKR